MEKKKILIVDDEESCLFLLESTLKEIEQTYNQFGRPFNYDVETMTNGTELNNKLEKFLKGIDGDLGLVITDDTMSGINGIDIIKKYSKLEKFKKVPFILISGYSGKEYMNEAKQAGAFDYIEKPFNIKDVKVRVLDAIDYSKKINP